MLTAYSYIPEIHKLVDIPVKAMLLREIGERVVTYHHQVFGTWVVSLMSDDGTQLLDLGILGEGVEPPTPSRELVWKIINRIKSMISNAEARRRLKQCQRNRVAEDVESLSRTDWANRKIYRKMKQCHGPHVADQWARRVGYESATGNKPVEAATLGEAIG